MFIAARTLFLLLTLLALLITSPICRAEPALLKLPALMDARAAHQATLLPNGEVLLSGGCGGRCDRMLASSERYDPARKQFRAAASLHTARSGHSAIALRDGRVLVVGGWAGQAVTASAELYDPVHDRFEPLPPMHVARAGATASLLPDGRVLLAGGQDSQLEPVNAVEIFDPDSGRFVRAAALTEARMNHVAVTLQDGRVLLIGGRQSRRGAMLASSEWFAPDTGRWQRAGALQTARHKHAAVRLADGRVLVLGGSDGSDDRGRYRSSELFDPISGRFSAGPQMQWPRFKIMHALAALADGRAVIAGGARQIELFAPVQLRFEPVSGELDYAPELATATVLATGEVLLAGGYDEQVNSRAQAWLIRL
ncbi:MAG: kelch repeat-containing protein [Permianibacter sp.]